MEATTRTIEIPTSLNDITTETLITYLKLQDDKDISEEDRILKIFQIFLNITEKEMRLFKLEDLEDMVTKLGKSLEKETKLKRVFELDGVEYGMIPNFDDILFGEYIDLDDFITPTYAGEIKEDEAYQFLSVLYRPIIKSTSNIYENNERLYKIEEYDTDIHKPEVMRNCPSDVYIAAVSFFFYLRRDLLMTLKTSLVQMVEEVMQTKTEQTSVLDGDGMAQLTTSLEVISSSIEKLQNEPSWKHLLSLPTINKMGIWLEEKENTTN